MTKAELTKAERDDLYHTMKAIGSLLAPLYPEEHGADKYLSSRIETAVVMISNVFYRLSLMKGRK